MFQHYVNKFTDSVSAGGVSRKILGYTPNLMNAEVRFESGQKGAMHHHPHDQITYVVTGRFLYHIEHEGTMETLLLEPGDAVVVTGDVMHGIDCLDSGVVLDMFSPCRDDFLK